jgi:WD40 repeat protein
MAMPMRSTSLEGVLTAEGDLDIRQPASSSAPDDVERTKTHLVALSARVTELDTKLQLLQAEVERVSEERVTVRAEEVDQTKTHLATASAPDADLGQAELPSSDSRLGFKPGEPQVEVEHASAELPSSETKLGFKASELKAEVERVAAERDAVRAQRELVKNELDTLVNAPVSEGRDPFEWLPDELVLMILLSLPFEALWYGACAVVCWRWTRLLESAPVKQRKRDGRWAAYAAGVIKPRALKVGDDAEHRSLEGYDGSLRERMQRMESVNALAVGPDGKIYSGGKSGKSRYDYHRDISVWRGDDPDNAYLRTLASFPHEGYADAVLAIVVGLDGKVWSASKDETIRVWAPKSRESSQSEEDPVGASGQSSPSDVGSCGTKSPVNTDMDDDDHDARAESGIVGADGNDDDIAAAAAAAAADAADHDNGDADDNTYINTTNEDDNTGTSNTNDNATTNDNTTTNDDHDHDHDHDDHDHDHDHDHDDLEDLRRLFGGYDPDEYLCRKLGDDKVLHTLTGHSGSVTSLAVGLDGKIYSGSSDKTIRVWSGEHGAHIQTLEGHTDDVYALAVGLDGKVYSGSEDRTVRVWSGGDDGTHLQTLEGHRYGITAIAAGRDGKIFSADEGRAIFVWRGDDGTGIFRINYNPRGVFYTLRGWTTLCVGLDGKIYTGFCYTDYGDGGTGTPIMKVRSGEYPFTLLHTIFKKREGCFDKPKIYALATMRDGSIISGGNGPHTLIKW